MWYEQKINDDRQAEKINAELQYRAVNKIYGYRNSIVGYAISDGNTVHPFQS